MRRTGGWLGMLLVGWLSGVPQAGANHVVLPVDGTAWVIESSDYTGDVKDQIARVDARYTIRVLRDGWVEIPLTLQGVTVTAIDIAKKPREAHVAPRGGTYALVASHRGTYEVRVKFSHLVSQEGQVEALRFGIPQATFSTMTLFVPRKDVELRPEDQLYVERQPEAGRGGVRLIARLGAANRIDLGWNTRPTTPEKVEPVFYGEVSTLVTLEEELARVNAILVYRVTQGELSSLDIRFPSSLSVLNLRGANIDDWHIAEADGQKILTVTLRSPLKETTYRLILEGEGSLARDAATYQPPEITLVGAKQERGYLAVAREGNLEVAFQEAEGMTRIDPRELPEALTGFSPAALAFRYHQHPYRVSLGMTRHQDHPVLAAIVERADLATVLSRQGELMTRAAYLVKANKKQFLEVRLPEGATLWSCLVGGTSVKPVEGTKGVLLVPLATTQEAAHGVSVELVYFERRPALTGIGSLRLSGPQLDAPTTVANWTLYTPRDIKFLRTGGNIERGTAAFAFLDEPFIQTASADELKVLGMDRVAAAFGGFRQRLSKVAAQNGAYQETYEAQRGSRRAGDARDADGFSLHAMLPTGAEAEPAEDLAAAWLNDMKEAGILPLKIQLPKAGSIHHFNRLMTSQDALALEATFVHLRMGWMVFAAVALLLMSGGAVAVARFRT